MAIALSVIFPAASLSKASMAGLKSLQAADFINF